jgi:hypothetical protein
MQFGPHQDPEEIAPQLLDLVRVAQVDEVMFFFFGEELNDGHETLERIREWIDRSRPYRDALVEAGVIVSLNPWHSLLHCDRGRHLKPGQDWQRMVDPDGRTCEAVVCPLDQGWRRYYEETLRLYAREDFRVIWIDDDIRFHNHAPLHWGGCFCPLHVEAFNRRAGVEAARDEIVSKCTAPGPPHPWREIWMDVWDETQLEMITQWREIVEAEGTRLGLMSSSFEAHSAEGRRWDNWWSALSGGRPPVHRPHFWGYGDATGASLPGRIAILDQNRTIQPSQLESGPEIECFPYGRWNKSLRQIGAQMALAHILGSTDLNISLYDFMGNRPDDEPERAEFLRRWRPTCDWLADQFPMTLRPVGVGIPWSQDMGRRIHLEEGGQWGSLACPAHGWADGLGAAGHAFCLRPSPAVNALAGPIAWSFSDDELRAWLSAGLLLDGIAAGILVERGLGSLIGVEHSRFITQDEVLYSVEHCLDEAFAVRMGGQMSVNGKSYSARLFQAELADGARVASDLRGPTQDVVGHGLVLFDNDLGGQVAIVPWSADSHVPMDVHRAAQFKGILDYLDPEHAHGSVQGGPWLVPQFLSDTSRWRGVVWNASPDQVEEVQVRPPSAMGMFPSAVQVNARGERHDAEVQGDRIRLSRPLHQWEFVVLM